MKRLKDIKDLSTSDVIQFKEGNSIVDNKTKFLIKEVDKDGLYFIFYVKYKGVSTSFSVTSDQLEDEEILYGPVENYPYLLI